MALHWFWLGRQVNPPLLNSERSLNQKPRMKLLLAGVNRHMFSPDGVLASRGQRKPLEDVSHVCDLTQEKVRY